MTEELRRGHSLEIVPPAQSPSQPEAAQPENLAPGGEPGGEDVLLIDGEVVPYLKTAEGIRIYYQKPAASIIEAARSYVDTQPDISK